jgi:hypothetical protein
VTTRGGRGIAAGGGAVGIPDAVGIPKKKKDQLSLAQSKGILLPCDRPDPDGPGGLGAEESGTERTGPTQ